MENLLNKIKTAFLWRKLPLSLYEYSDDIVDDLSDLYIFTEVSWEKVLNGEWDYKISPSAVIAWNIVTFDMIRNNTSAYVLFSDEAFTYYLPAVLSLSLRYNDPYMPSIHSILWRNWWKIELTSDEYEALKKWIGWIFENDSLPHDHQEEIIDNISRVKIIKVNGTGYLF